MGSGTKKRCKVIEPTPNGNMRNRDMILLQQKSLYFSERTSIFKVQYQSQKNDLWWKSKPFEACNNKLWEWLFLQQRGGNGNLDRMMFLFGNTAKVNVMWIPMPKESFSTTNRAYAISRVLLVELFFDCNKLVIAVTTKIFLVSMPILSILVYGFRKTVWAKNNRFVFKSNFYIYTW